MPTVYQRCHVTGVAAIVSAAPMAFSVRRMLQKMLLQICKLPLATEFSFAYCK